MRTGEMINSYNEHQRALGMANKTIEWKRFLLKRFFSWIRTQGIREIHRINRENILQYQQYISNLSNKKGKAYNPRVQNRHITAVRQLFKYLQLLNADISNPANGVQLAREPKTLPKGILSIREMDHLMMQPDTTSPLGLRDRAILEVLYTTGMRRSELLNLDINDICPDRHTIMIRQGKYSRDRVVPCGRIAREQLQQYLIDSRPLLQSDPQENAVFLSATGSRLGKQGLKLLIDRCANEAGFNKRITPHTCRHSCATHMSEAGADISIIQRLLGHARIDTTAIYIAVSLNGLKQTHSRCHPREKAARRKQRVGAQEHRTESTAN